MASFVGLSGGYQPNKITKESHGPHIFSDAKRVARKALVEKRYGHYDQHITCGSGGPSYHKRNRLAPEAIQTFRRKPRNVRGVRQRRQHGH